MSVDFYENISSDEIIHAVQLDYVKPIKFKPATAIKPSLVDEAINDIKYKMLFAEYGNTSNEPKTRKSKKSGRISSKDIPDTLPSNLKQYTLPDGSVVCINTDETEFSEESVIDSIIKPK